MHLKSLLQELERLPHSGRMRRMVEVGRQAASDRSASETLAELSRGGVFQRTLALQACYGSRDGECVVRALEDPSRLARGLAVQLVAELCDDEQVRRRSRSFLRPGATCTAAPAVEETPTWVGR